MNTPKQHSDVLRYVYAIAAIAAGSTALIIIIIYIGYSNQVRSGHRLSQFHGRTIMLTAEVTARLSAIEAKITSTRRVATDGPYPRSAADISDRQIQTACDSIQQVLESIASLQLEYNDQLFAGTVRRAQQRCERIRQVLPVGIRSPISFLNELEALALTTHQLQRLHSIAANDALESATVTSSRRTRTFIIIVALISSVAAIVITRLLVLLRRRLQKHLQTETELLDRERQLQHTQKLDALGTLVGGVAHDFNNILTAILGHTEALLAEVSSGDPHYLGLHHIQQAGKRAANLTRQLLSFSRNDAANPRKVNLKFLVRGMEPLMRRLIREDISLAVECHGDIGCVHVDPLQLEQVLMNLVVNSRDAMADGGQLTIRTSHVQMGADQAAQLGTIAGSYCRICVEDNGCGMTPEVRSRVFEPFFTTKDRGKGTGLGLSTVHGIVTKSRGFIILNSQVARGTRVEIYLPRNDKPSENKSAATDLRMAGNIGGSETILLVEDEKQVRDLTANALCGAGYHVLSASNGSEALQVCRERRGPLHLILTDVIMPGMGGPDLVSQARQLFPNTGVVYVSGYTDETMLKEVRRSGHRLVPKPFKLEQLLRIIRLELDGRRAAQVRRRA